jgi:uncharacterized protein
MPAQRARLDGGRWHFQHGPIDLVIGAEGDAAAVAAAHAAAWARFETVLPELVGELRVLRRPVDAQAPGGAPIGPPADDAFGACPLQGVIARRMWHACWPHRAGFITPMAAVAGAVAQEIVAHYARAGVHRAWVNNGGDIALHLAPGASVRIGVFTDLARCEPAAGALPIDVDFELRAERPVRGIATSGWRGRSFSRGIADSVTVLARTAAIADAAATVIANAVDVADPRIVRRPASELKDDSDLGEIEVTVDVPRLAPGQVIDALHAGRRCALALQRLGLIDSALLVCQHRAVAVTVAVPGPALPHIGLAAAAPAAFGSVFA